MTEIIYKKESYAIIGACFELYNEKGCGFLEPVCHECLAIEFEHQGIPAISKPSLTLRYRDRMLRQTYEPDFICFGKIGHYPQLEYQRIAKTRSTNTRTDFPDVSL